MGYRGNILGRFGAGLRVTVGLTGSVACSTAAGFHVKSVMCRGDNGVVPIVEQCHFFVFDFSRAFENEM